ncbi:MAG TPA: hypothetical protein VK596_05060 [Edaphobacter sp.]|nr:hypothetical protein [Edaphobacter sp.]
MKTRASSFSFTIMALCIASLLGIAATAQQPSSTPSSGKTTDAKTEPAKAPLTPEEKKRADLVADTERLYKLTQELKAEVAKSNKDTLSVSVVKKAQEVERLAKSIKDRSRIQ